MAKRAIPLLSLLAACASVSATAHADILVIYADGFASAATRYSAHRLAVSTNCLPQHAVTAYAVSAADGDQSGTVDADELKTFILSNATGMDGLLLLGDYDLIPTYFESDPDNPWDDGLIDGDDDLLPDIPVGRVPASTGDEAMNWVEKLEDYEGTRWAGYGSAEDWMIESRILARDNDIVIGNDFLSGTMFRNLADFVIGLMPDDYAGCYTYSGFSSELPIGQRADYVESKINSGVGLIFATGTLASEENLVGFLGTSLDPLDLSALNNYAQYPTVVGLSCDLIGELHPQSSYDNVLKELLVAKDKGIICAVAPSAPAKVNALPAIAIELLKRWQRPICAGVDLGSALVAAKSELLSNPARDGTTVRSMQIYGDPLHRFPFRDIGFEATELLTSTSGTGRAYEGQYVRLDVEFVDSTYVVVDPTDYVYVWDTDVGVINGFQSTSTGAPSAWWRCGQYDGMCDPGTVARLSAYVKDKRLFCLKTAKVFAEIEIVPLSDDDGCPIVQTKPYGQWIDRNSILGERIYAAAIECTDELHLAPPVAASPMYEVKIRESDAVNYTLLDHVQIRYMDRPIGTETFVSQSGKAYEATAVTPDSVWLALGVDVTSDLAAADTLNLTVAEGDTVFALFADSVATVAAGLPVIRSRTKPHLYQADLGGQGEWGLRMLPGYGVGPMEPLLPRQEWYPCFADSPVVVRGDGIPDTVAWAIGEVHELDEIKLLDNATLWTGGNTYPVLNAIHSDSGLVTTLVNSDDGNYCRIDYGQDVKLSFTYPFVPAGFQREIVLHINGTYEHINAPFNSDPTAGQGLPWGFHVVYPNPTNLRTQVQFVARGQGRCRLAVYDVAGRCIRTIIDEPAPPAGLVRTTWNGMDDRGNRVAAGVYFLRLQEGSLREAEKVVVLR